MASRSILEHFSLFLWRELPIPDLVREAILYIINYKFTVGVTGIIENDEKKILLFKHNYYNDNPWGLPSGIVKQESLTSAMVREINEESNLVVKVIDPIGVVHEKRRLVFLFKCLLVENNFKPSEEVSDFKFFSPDELSNVGASTKKIIRSLMEDNNNGIKLSKKIRLLDFTGTELYNRDRMPERISSEAAGKDLKKKEKVVVSKDFIFFNNASDEEVPLPPYAYDSYPSKVPSNIPISDRASDSGVDSQNQDKTEN